MFNTAKTMRICTNNAYASCNAVNKKTKGYRMLLPLPH